MKRRIVIQIDDELHEKIREEAFHQRVSQAELVRRAIREYLKIIDPAPGTDNLSPPPQPG